MGAKVYHALPVRWEREIQIRVFLPPLLENKVTDPVREFFGALGVFEFITSAPRSEIQKKFSRGRGVGIFLR